ncbi:hypothetical protein LINGRAHAP2_LOCUS20161 [Linum grandiflorum]
MTPPYASLGLNSMVWGLEPSRKFTIRSTYLLLTDLQEETPDLHGMEFGSGRARIKFAISFGWLHIIVFLPMKSDDVVISLTRCFVPFVQTILNPVSIS